MQVNHFWVDLTDVSAEIKSLMQMIHTVLPGMKQRGRGCIINISSGVSSYLPACPMLAVYAASKAYVDNLSASLAAEYREFNIDVQVRGQQQWCFVCRCIDYITQEAIYFIIKTGTCRVKASEDELLEFRKVVQSSTVGRNWANSETVFCILWHMEMFIRWLLVSGAGLIRWISEAHQWPLAVVLFMGEHKSPKLWGLMDCTVDLCTSWKSSVVTRGKRVSTSYRLQVVRGLVLTGL